MTGAEQAEAELLAAVIEHEAIGKRLGALGLPASAVVPAKAREPTFFFDDAPPAARLKRLPPRTGRS